MNYKNNKYIKTKDSFKNAPIFKDNHIELPSGVFYVRVAKRLKHFAIFQFKDRQIFTFNIEGIENVLAIDTKYLDI